MQLAVAPVQVALAEVTDRLVASVRSVVGGVALKARRN
jgi:hypothetical protein